MKQTAYREKRGPSTPLPVPWGLWLQLALAEFSYTQEITLLGKRKVIVELGEARGH